MGRWPGAALRVSEPSSWSESDEILLISPFLIVSLLHCYTSLSPSPRNRQIRKDFIYPNISYHEHRIRHDFQYIRL